MIPTPLSAVIFDKDGLLLDTETVVRTAMFQACEDLGHRMTDELHVGLIGQARDANDATLIGGFSAGRLSRKMPHLFRRHLPHRSTGQAGRP